MHYLLLIGAFLFFAFIAPFKTVVVFVGLLLTVTLVVKVSAQAVANMKPTLGEAFQAVAYSLMLAAAALLVLLSFSSGTGVHSFGGISAIVVLFGLLTAYSLGFKIGLGASLGASFLVALMSTVVSAILLWAVRSNAF